MKERMWLMLLSVVMMVKNEDRFLRKTLNALKPITDSIDSEIIILDTGSTDKTVEIAKTFTDKVYFCEWNDDFGSMRNKSISYASGEWLLVIDADEVLNESKDLIEFFKSDMHKIYNSASIEVNNIMNGKTELNNYESSVELVRLFRKSGFKYTGKIHEQPIFSEPLFRRLSKFNHYGYLFVDEEFRMNKIKRNYDILVKELKDKPNEPYLIYQLGKNFMTEKKDREALDYIEKSYKIYEDANNIPGYVTSTLVMLYFINGKYKKCEEICLKYIEDDKNNIDIYYFLGKVQRNLGNMENSMLYYERYLYLLENYELSTQANDMLTDSATLSNRDRVIIELIEMHYVFEEYEKVLEKYKSIDTFENKKDVYKLVFASLDKLNKRNEILDYYAEIPNSRLEKNIFYNNIEIFVRTLKEEDKTCIYEKLSSLYDNYGRLNKARLQSYVSIEECRKILKNEKDTLYSPVINIAINKGENLLEIFYDFDSVWVEKYMQNELKHNKDLSIVLYQYIMLQPNTDDFNKIRIYRVLSKVLLENGSLYDSRYKQILYIYAMYSYQYICSLYKNFNDHELLKYVNNDVDRFVIEFKIFNEAYRCEEHISIEKLQSLLYEYPRYAKAIKLIIEDLQEELKETEELRKLRNMFLDNIENMINVGEIHAANSLLTEYLSKFDEDVRVLNIQGILLILDSKFEEADLIFKSALSMDFTNEDTIHNINYLKVKLGESYCIG
jgi:glycosyltransferase involved in cell wall biosynthesis